MAFFIPTQKSYMQYLKDLQALCAINSYTQNKQGVDSVAKLMQQWIEPLGFTTKVFPRKQIGDHYLFSSKKVSGERILLLGHNDTVFPVGDFESFTEDEKWVYGPGVCDMKGGNIVALEALKQTFHTHKDIYNIDFLLVSDEESGSDDSKALTLQLAKEYDYCFVFEAAGPNLELVTGRKGVGTFTIRITGKAAHAGTSYEKGINANLEASYKLQELTKLTNLKAGTTVNVGKINGGIGANTISPQCELLLEIRYTTEQEKKRLLSEIQTITDTSFTKHTKAQLHGLIQRDVMEPNSAQEHFMKKLENISGHTIVAEQRGGVSDANHVASCGVVTLDGFGPFGDGDHTKQERALKSSFVQRIDMVNKVFDFFQSNACRF